MTVAASVRFIKQPRASGIQKKALFLVVELLSLICLTASPTAQAKLIDRGGGLLYDDVLNVTWMQDANYSMSSGRTKYGAESWYSAQSWASSLVYNDPVRGTSLSGWRLPRLSVPNADCGPAFSGICGYKPDPMSSELAYMYYVNLGLKGYPDQGFGIRWPGTFGPDGMPVFNVAVVGVDGIPIFNLTSQSVSYWMGTEAINFSFNAWTFGLGAGINTQDNKPDFNLAWLVRDGDVSPVPEPSQLILFFVGLAVLLELRYKRSGGFKNQAQKGF